MPTSALFLDWRRSLLTALGLTLLIIGVLYLFVSRTPPSVAAQGTLRLQLTKTLQGTDVIKVGQYLTFTIRMTNTGTISITELPLDDQYDAAIIRFERADPPPTDASPGALAWTNLTTDTLFGVLPPGKSITVTTVFRAIAPKPATVNAAQSGTLVGFKGETGSGGGDKASGGTVGGKVVVQKELAPGQTPMSGHPLTFTIAISNAGGADVVNLPLQDTFLPAYLQFWKASPRPTSINTATGELRWADLLPALGLKRLQPNQTITVTTVFTALQAIDGVVVNRVGAVNVRDEFGNNVEAPRQADVPIRILPGDSAATPVPVTPTSEATTATPVPTSKPRTPKPAPQPSPTSEATPLTTAPVTATAEIAPTVTITATTVVTATTIITTTATITATTPTPGGQPSTLPNTSDPASPSRWWMLGLLFLVGGLLVLAWRRAKASV